MADHNLDTEEGVRAFVDSLTPEELSRVEALADLLLDDQEHEEGHTHG